MLAEKTLNILEENNITVYNRTEQDGEFCRDIEFYSNADEDVIETVWYDGTDSGFIEEFRQLANDFDADEHAEMWISHRGENGVPDDIRTLIDDAEGIKNKLLSVAEQLEEIIKEKRRYTVTVTISNGEEENTLTFETEAYSLEEATEEIQSQLDV